MSTVTLDAIKAEQSKLAQMIAAFEASAKNATQIHLPEALIKLAEDEHYAGIITGKDGDASYHLILLPGDAEDINFADATAWAKGQGGELPTRREQSLLFANCKDQFDERSYWSSEEYSAGGAWYQSFISVIQGSLPKFSELRARAVRRLIIE